MATDPQWVFLESDGSPMALERFPVMQVITSDAALPRDGHDRPSAAGTDRWLDVSAVPIVDDAGRLEQVVVTFIDISDRMRAEETLAKQAERTELVLSASRLGVWDWNMVTGEATFDDRWAEILGYRLADLEPVSIDTWLQRVHPDDLSAVERDDRRARQGHQAVLRQRVPDAAPRRPLGVGP